MSPWRSALHQMALMELLVYLKQRDLYSDYDVPDSGNTVTCKDSSDEKEKSWRVEKLFICCCACVESEDESIQNNEENESSQRSSSRKMVKKR